jgi:hypothetical protein
MRPRWLTGMLLRTLIPHGMPRVENMGPRSPMISRSAHRPRGGLDRLSWLNIERIRRSTDVLKALAPGAKFCFWDGRFCMQPRLPAMRA